MIQCNERLLKQFLIESFSSNRISLKAKMYELYRYYSYLNINNLDDLKNSSDDFYMFLVDNLELIKQCTRDTEHELSILFSTFKSMLDNKVNNNEFHKQQCLFVGIVNSILSKKHKHLLDVGPGHLAYSSILLGENNSKVTAMDESFWLDDESLKRMNVNPYIGYFYNKTNIDDFDMIVGKSPCTAIDSIVYLCKKYKKPYFIETCDCVLPSISYFCRKWELDKSKTEMEEMVTNTHGSLGWKDLLPELDKDIGFIGKYAYNIGDNKSNVESLVDENSHKI